LAGVETSKLTCDALAATFIGASELVKARNNSAVLVRDAAPVEITDVNQVNRDFWSRSN